MLISTVLNQTGIFLHVCSQFCTSSFNFEHYMFGEFLDKIPGMDEKQQDSNSISNITSSHYLKHEQSAGIIYAITNSNQETKL